MGVSLCVCAPGTHWTHVRRGTLWRTRDCGHCDTVSVSWKAVLEVEGFLFTKRPTDTEKFLSA